MKNKICLVLGAGASKAYGYPLGSVLRNSILSLRNHEVFAHLAGSDPNRSPFIESKVHKFIDAFNYSQIVSIDSFLAKNQEYEEIGKLAIALVLLKFESEKNLFISSDDQDNWYQYFWNNISDSNWDEFDVSHISIVTFNYDRSLERYLTTVATNTYGGKTPEEIKSRLSKLNIIHVYGSLGPNWPWDDNYSKYGSNDIGAIRSAANTIKIIPESRDDSTQIVAAVKALKEATKIAFLGFGFNSLNMRRLDLEESCKVDFLTDQGWINRDIYFTCLGVEPEEAVIYSTKLDKKLQSRNEYGYPISFYKLNCTMLLRKTQFLD